MKAVSISYGLIWRTTYNMRERKSIGGLIMEYFRAHALQDLPHGPVVDWVEEQYVALYGRKPRDIWRSIRDLHERGTLIQVRKGIYRFDPDIAYTVELFDFPTEVKDEIFERDNYRCVICGRGRADGVEIHADHVIPRSKGGTNFVFNGQTLCTQHNNLKKNYSQTELGKRLFIKIYQTAAARGDEQVVEFCKDIFDTYDRHGIDAHIRRPDEQAR